MRIAAVALVLIVGAAVVLAFANTLNSWVVGGLFGGLAAILISIPISLALFTVLARRQETRQLSLTQIPEEEEFEFADDYEEGMMYAVDGSLVPEEDLFGDTRRHALLEGRRAAYEDVYEEDKEDFASFAPREPRNYPIQPRATAHPLAQAYDANLAPERQQAPGGSRRERATHSLAQHQSLALHLARQEAQQRAASKRSNSLSRREQESHSRASQRSRTSRNLRQQAPGLASQRHPDEYETRLNRNQSARPALPEEEAYDNFSMNHQQEHYQHYPRRPSYPRNPRSESSIDPRNTFVEDDDEQETPPARRSRRTSDHLSGNLYNPLVRRAPYLYDDDPLREEFAQQLDPERPITHRSSSYDRYEEDRD